MRRSGQPFMVGPTSDSDSTIDMGYCTAVRIVLVEVVVVVVVVGQTVGSISSKTLAYDCLYTLELCTASMIATS